MRLFHRRQEQKRPVCPIHNLACYRTDHEWYYVCPDERHRKDQPRIYRGYAIIGQWTTHYRED